MIIGAVNGARTRDPQLGKLMLYQLSYYRVMLVLKPKMSTLKLCAVGFGCKFTNYFDILQVFGQVLGLAVFVGGAYVNPEAGEGVTDYGLVVGHEGLYQIGGVEYLTFGDVT